MYTVHRHTGWAGWSVKRKLSRQTSRNFTTIIEILTDLQNSFASIVSFKHCHTVVTNVKTSPCFKRVAKLPCKHHSFHKLTKFEVWWYQQLIRLTNLLLTQLHRLHRGVCLTSVNRASLSDTELGGRSQFTMFFVVDVLALST